MTEKIKTYYEAGFKMQDIYDEIGSCRTVDKIVSGFSDEIKLKRSQYLAGARKEYKKNKNKEYRERGIDPITACVKRQHEIDVCVLSAEKYYN